MLPGMDKFTARTTQRLYFGDLAHGKCRPTDIDWAFETRHVYILGELKTGTKDVPIGQRIFIENTVKGMQATGRQAYGIVSTHDTLPHEMVMVKNTMVREVYHNKVWRPIFGLTTGDIFDAIIRGRFTW